MFTIPTPRLGNVTAITIASPDPEASLKFYQKLGFKELMRMDFPFPWIQITDEALLIMLRKDNNPYIALTYYVKNIDQIVNELEAQGISFTQKPKSKDIVKRYVMQSPDGMNISLVHIPENGFQQPPGPTMLTMPQEDYSKPEKYVNKTIGMWGEFAEPVKDLEASIAFWEKLGFVALSKYQSPQPWAILSDGLAIVGLHQTDEFSNVCMTYFASDMKDKLEKLKNEGLEVYKQFGAGNAVVKTPENQYINLFSFGM
jgi:predicted lactoylglutathione lyase